MPVRHLGLCPEHEHAWNDRRCYRECQRPSGRNGCRRRSDARANDRHYGNRYGISHDNGWNHDDDYDDVPGRSAGNSGSRGAYSSGSVCAVPRTRSHGSPRNFCVFVISSAATVDDRHGDVGRCQRPSGVRNWNEYVKYQYERPEHSSLTANLGNKTARHLVSGRCFFIQSGRPDLNRGPPAPKAGAIPGYATPRGAGASYYILP